MEVLSATRTGDLVRLTVIIPRRLGSYVEFRQGDVEVRVR